MHIKLQDGDFTLSTEPSRLDIDAIYAFPSRMEILRPYVGDGNRGTQSASVSSPQAKPLPAP